MDTFEKITRAREILELPETATMEVIKSNYRRLLAMWHPDRCQEDGDECTEKTRKIIAAYQTIMEYCNHYQYSFSEDAAKRNPSPEDWWHERFVDDPLWGNAKKKR